MSDEFMIPKEAVQAFIDRRRADANSLRQALGLKAHQEFERVGHQLKGNAVSFGFAELQSLGVELENAGKQRDWASAENLVKLLENWVEKTSVEPVTDRPLN